MLTVRRGIFGEAGLLGAPEHFRRADVDEEGDARVDTGGVDGLDVTEDALVIAHRQVDSQAAPLQQRCERRRITGVAADRPQTETSQPTLAAPATDDGHQRRGAQQFRALDKTRTDETAGPDNRDRLHADGTALQCLALAAACSSAGSHGLSSGSARSYACSMAACTAAACAPVTGKGSP